uniref:Uncharacterized protein n=1 Tax=Aureoumbra lagunensis TaxID=44058 RepID=A0A7S3K1Q8_9STRA|mmetsp:Transcript_5154/g.7259  ORF Transcript_5154/g.7259 Transcript_5154/m.7259 type:complete len:278 (-) Transcript_5154:406-1239(-)
MIGLVLFKVIVFVWASKAKATYVNQYIPGKTLVIEYGQPRTATTLQYTIAKHMALLKNHELGIQTPSFGFKSRIHFTDLKVNNIWKTHRLEFSSLVNQTNISVLLLTTTHLFGAAYIQLMEEVEQDPTSVVDDRTYIRFWDLLRLCCGTQQSISHRLYLHGCPPLRPWFSVRSPHCEIYNLTAVEEIAYFAENAFGDRPFVNPFTIEDHRGDERIGSCAKVEKKIIDGIDFNGRRFNNDCPGLVKKWASREYHDYICRYGYEKNTTDCTLSNPNVKN